MRRFLSVAGVLLLTMFSLLINPQSACACSCAVATEAEYDNLADLVFTGVVTDIDRPLLGGGGGNFSVKFAVEEVSKGQAAQSIVLTTASDSATCGFNFGVGNRYRVYSHSGATGLCSGNKALGAAPSAGEVAPSALGGAAPEVPLDEGFPYGWVALGGGVVIAGAVVLLLLPMRRRVAEQ